MSDKYFNDSPYMLTRGDYNPPFIFTLKRRTTGGIATPVDLLPSAAMRVLVREKGAETNLATIACNVVEIDAAQFEIPSWPTTVTAAMDSSGEPITGKLEIQFQFSRDGTFTDTQTAQQWAEFNMLELFGE